MRGPWAALASSLLLLLAAVPAAAQDWQTAQREYEIAARYAPHLYQMVDRRQPRLDYLARFDFDGNWRADDNWANLANPELALPAYVYFSVAETSTHFFIHYVCFHPRDWKGNWLSNGSLQLLKTAARPLILPRWLGLDVLSLAHENDIEGMLVVVAREGEAGLTGRTILVETFSHYRFRAYHIQGQEKSFRTRGGLVHTSKQRPVVYIESRGHGLRNHLRPKRKQVALHYRYTGAAETPGEDLSRPVGYELLPLHDTLWKHALEHESQQRTFSRFRLYDRVELAEFFAGGPPRIGTALRGRKRGRNRAVAPWGWKNNGVRGQWFFDPARNVYERHRPLRVFATHYLSNRFLARLEGVEENARGTPAARPITVPTLR